MHKGEKVINADLLLTGGLVYNSSFKCFFKGILAIKNGRILYVGDETDKISSPIIINCKGKWLVPGLIDIHMHIESSMVTPKAFSDAAIINGVTTCVAEPHEIANIFGIDGIKRFISMSSDCDVDIFYGVPSSVPSTQFETTGAALIPDDYKELMGFDRVKCLGEVMDCFNVINNDDSIINKIIRKVKEYDKSSIIEGHCPRFMGLDLQKILYMGVDSDHTQQTPETMMERIRTGMFVEIQEKTLTKDIAKVIIDNSIDGLFSFVTDDVMADDFVNGHLSKIVRLALKLGIPVERAIYAATKSPADRMNFRDRGTLSAGKIADILVIDDIESFNISSVYKNGMLVEPNKTTPDSGTFPECYYNSVNLPALSLDDFKFNTDKNYTRVLCRVMNTNEKSTFTEETEELLDVENGEVIYSKAGLRLVKVFERHKGTGNVATGLIAGSCLKRGAVATTYAHDHHNLLVIGENENDMVLAANTVINNNGGICVADNGEISAFINLPVGGILSDKSVSETGKELAKVVKALKNQGYRSINPIMSLCTVSLPVSPALKITDMGLVDVNNGKIVDLIKEVTENKNDKDYS